MIAVESLTKRYGKTVAVDGLTFEARPGSILGFLGPNGAGKTTTLRIILGLAHPTSGGATIDGSPYRSLTDPTHSVVVFPAPLGPRKPRIEPARASKVRSSTATVLP